MTSGVEAVYRKQHEMNIYPLSQWMYVLCYHWLAFWYDNLDLLYSTLGLTSVEVEFPSNEHRF